MKLSPIRGLLLLFLSFFCSLRPPHSCLSIYSTVPYRITINIIKLSNRDMKKKGAYSMSTFVVPT